MLWGGVVVHDRCRLAGIWAVHIPALETGKSRSISPFDMGEPDDGHAGTAIGGGNIKVHDGQ